MSNTSNSKIILPIHGLPAPSFKCGADITRKILGLKLVENGFEVMFIGCYNSIKGDYVKAMAYFIIFLKKNNISWKVINGNTIHYEYKGMQCFAVPSEKFLHFIEENTNEGDTLFALNRSSTKFVEIGKRKKAKTVAWITDAVVERKSLFKANPDFVLFNSQEMADFGKIIYKGNYHIVPSPFEKNKNVQLPKKFQKTITLINPIEKKGLKTFLELSEILPEYTFYAIESWTAVQLEEKYLQKNVRFFKAQIDLNPLFEKTGILLYPSHFNEGLGRVIVEAGLTGIPSVVSNKGAVPTTVGDGGIVVHNFDVADWVNAIRKIESNYEYYSKKAFAQASSMAIDTIAKLRELQIL